jgi:hypothetical protein
MGGFGSGPYGTGGLLRKRTVEETYYLNIQSLKKDLNNKLLTISWNNGKITISVLTKNDHIIIAYSAGDERIKERVNIDSTQVGYGERLWFNCPSCDDRTARLYLVRKGFACRTCQNLTYLSCQESGDPLDYLYLKIKRLQKQLGMISPDPYDIPFLKPKNMHQRTYNKLRNRLIDIQDEREQYFLTQCLRRGY